MDQACAPSWTTSTLFGATTAQQFVGRTFQDAATYLVRPLECTVFRILVCGGVSIKASALATCTTKDSVLEPTSAEVTASDAPKSEGKDEGDA